MPLPKSFRVLIADDQPVVRRGLRALLETQPGVEICAEARTGLEAVEQAKRTRPDLVILDVAMPELHGLDAIVAMRQELTSTMYLIHSIHLSAELAREALKAGALGYVLKSDGEQDLLTAVEQLRRHQPYFTTRLAVAMAENFVAANGNGHSSNANGNKNGDSPLTERELGVLQMLAEGKSNKEVAAAMNVSVRTIESHRNRIMHKMHFGSFSELVRYAVRNSLVEP